MTPKYPFHIVRETSSGGVCLVLWPCIWGWELPEKTDTKGDPGAGGRLYLGQACEMPVPKWYWPGGTEGGSCGLFPDAHTVVTGECGAASVCECTCKYLSHVEKMWVLRCGLQHLPFEKSWWQICLLLFMCGWVYICIMKTKRYLDCLGVILKLWM